MCIRDSFYDANGNEFSDIGDRITVDTGEISYRVAINKVKSLPLDFEVTGTVAPGYQYTGVELSLIHILKESPVGTGFDAYKEEYVDMIKAGILDPAKVTRSALQNATSVASTLLTTESVVANIKEETPAMPAGGMGGMM